MEDKKIEETIKEEISRRIDEIKKGYKVCWSEADGCDEYGQKFWVECENGFSGRSWDVGPMERLDINQFLKNIIEEGIEFKGKIYYFNPTKRFEQYNIEVYLIDESSFKEMTKYKKVIKNMVSKYYTFLDNELKEKCKDLGLDFRCYEFNKLKEFKTKISNVVCLCKESFVLGLNFHLNSIEIQRLMNDFRGNMEWDDEEKIALGL